MSLDEITKDPQIRELRRACQETIHLTRDLLHQLEIQITNSDNSKGTWSPLEYQLIDTLQTQLNREKKALSKRAKHIREALPEEIRNYYGI